MPKFQKQVDQVAALFATVLLLISLVGCGGRTPTIDELWQTAMQDAVFSEDSEVMELVTLTPDDPKVIWDESGERVLLLTWHDYADDCMPGYPLPSGNGEIWAVSMGEMMAW